MGAPAQLASNCPGKKRREGVKNDSGARPAARSAVPVHTAARLLTLVLEGQPPTGTQSRSFSDLYDSREGC